MSRDSARYSATSVRPLGNITIRPKTTSGVVSDPTVMLLKNYLAVAICLAACTPGTVGANTQRHSCATDGHVPSGGATSTAPWRTADYSRCHAGRQADDPVDSSQGPADYAHAVISIDREPCRGECPAYHVTIFSDGLVQYEGTSSVATCGRASRWISLDDRDRIVESLRRATFFAADFAAPSCEFCGPSLTLAVLTPKHCRVVWRNDPYDRALAFLADSVEQIAGIRAWVDCPGPNCKPSR